MNDEYTYFVNSGGRCSTKSSAVSLVVMLDMAAHIEGHTVVFRQQQTQLRESVFEQFNWAISVLGLENTWKPVLAPKLKHVNVHTGQEIRYLGYDNAAMVTKGQKFKKGYCRNIVFEEADQFANFKEIKVGLASLLRSNGYDNAKHKVNIVYNPPRSKDAWINQPGAFSSEDVVHYHTTYLDVPEGWLSPQYVQLIEHTKATDRLQYEFEYLGKPIGHANLVFNNITTREITEEEYEESLESNKVYAGIDFGFKADPTTWIRFTFDGKRLVILDEYYAKHVFMTDVAEHIKSFDANFEDLLTICDSSEPREIVELQRLGINAHPCVKGKNSIDIGIKRLQGLKEIVIDRQRTPHVYFEWTNYCYKLDKNGDYVNKYTDKDDHTIDPVRYVLMLLTR